MENLEEVLEGLMLGDGYARKQALNAQLQLKCNSFDYVKYIKELLELNKIPVQSKIYTCKNGYNTGFQYATHSKVHPKITKLYNRWYKPKKTIPLDLLITPTSLLHWYIGDGYINRAKDKFFGLRLAAHSFSYNERINLCNILTSLKFSCRTDKRGVISINKSSSEDFLSYIGHPPVYYYEYKWNTKPAVSSIF